ncbi:DUF2269 family protein [Candidatus Vondammii sp. HM_W22]|uniref:DUF2269 family protein n=1 Tax=Candidatus Vondammii sp. HM_W22 TaxID=2687299 RepID=UPI001F13464B|nr:DUF2269 family protein [Candidatus Vondammii sp. HM_W22]
MNRCGLGRWAQKHQWQFFASAVIWIVILIPAQVMQSRMASAFQNDGTIPQRYWMLSRIWAIAGSIAAILPFTVLYFMVFKPQ